MDAPKVDLLKAHQERQKPDLYITSCTDTFFELFQLLTSQNRLNFLFEFGMRK